MRQTVAPAETSPPTDLLRRVDETPRTKGTTRADDAPRADETTRADGTLDAEVEAAGVLATAALAPPMAGTCAVCAFRDRSVQRRFFFAGAEGISEPSFLAEFGASGGYCAWHARRVVRHGDGPRYAYAYLYGLGLAVRRLTATPPTRLGPCLICATEHWAEDHALWAIASGEGSGEVAAGLTVDAPVCIKHGRTLLLRAPWREYETARARLTDRLDSLEAATSASFLSPTDRLTALSGPDRHAPEPGLPVASIQAPEWISSARTDGTAWSRGVLSRDGLIAELRAGRCPACSSAAAASGAFLSYLDEPRTLSATGGATVLQRGAAVGSALRWELEEAIRNSSWSVRYEPLGPETEAWRRAIAFGAGGAALDRKALPPDPKRPLPAV